MQRDRKTLETKMRFPSPVPDQVTESALVALATRAGVVGISELASVHSGGFGKGVSIHEHPGLLDAPAPQAANQFLFFDVFSDTFLD